VAFRPDFRYRWSWLLPADAEALWPLVSDTDRFNRDAGLPPVQEVVTSGGKLPNARKLLRITVKGVVLEWEEFPFEWIRPWRFGVIRRYRRGPLEEMRVLVELSPEGDGGTRMVYETSVQGRGVLGRLTIPVQIGLLSRIRFSRAFQRYARETAATTPPAPARPARPNLVASVASLTDKVARAGVPEALAAHLVEHIAFSDDMTVARIRPYALADLWGGDRRDVLAACLRATRAGLLDLRWDVLCPACRGVADGAATLRQLRTGAAHCDTCDIDFSPNFDQSVEISFRPAAAVRPVEVPPFCVAGPQVTPHIEVQQLLGPGERREVTPRMEPGLHRVRAFGVPGAASFRVEGGGAELSELATDGAEWRDAPARVDPGARLVLVNETGQERLFVVEHATWGDSATTAAEVTALDEFRDLFSSEVLAVGEFASVGNLAVLFTDLRGSTSLYRRVGDAAAFGRVMHHFDVLKEAVAAEDGAVVKTIGDAVMAVFRAPDAALRAVLAASARLEAAERDGGERLVLKAGVHYGPCICVTLNERLDYFGTTVNIAARLGSLSAGDDIVISDGVRREAAVETLLGDAGVSMSSLTAEIRGLEERLQVWRVIRPRGADA
jgi:class 3 adenylate cyclase